MDQSLPIYQSRPTYRSLGHGYAIYADRLELNFSMLLLKKNWIIEKDDIISIDTYSPPVIRTALWALKLDWADLYRHVGIKRKRGFFKQLRFTPEDPDAFVAKAREIFKLPAPSNAS